MDSLLRERALSLANRGVQQIEEKGTSHLVFLLDQEKYAVALAQLGGVVRFERLTPVPGSLPELCGLLNVRGEVRPVYDLRCLLGLEFPERNWSSSFALLAVLRGLPVCLQVSEVVDLLKIRKISGSAGVYSAGRTPDGVTLLDLELLSGHPLFKEED
ncbi:MAG: chemotaxis protein CheW [Vulcanimicrobiota bacterium]